MRNLADLPCPRIPLVFSRHYATAPWGGRRIIERFNRKDAPPECSESWEISARPDFPGLVTGGPYEGAGLDALASAYGAAFTGAKAPDPRKFPLLFKLIDARERLSVQVHPDDRTAQTAGGEAKSECWLVIDATADAALYAGLVPGTTREKLERASKDGDPSFLLERTPVRRGDALYIPGGTVHAIDAGCLVYEVQQSSDTTYRFYDWGRTGRDGKPRQLHIEEGLATTAYDRPAPKPVRAADGLETPYFSVRCLTLRGRTVFPGSASTFQAFFTVSGEAEIFAGGTTAAAPAGQSVLVPAGADATVSPAAGGAEIIRTTL